MNKKFFPELARRLRQEGVATGPAEENRLPVLLNGQEVMWVETDGFIVLAAGAKDDPETNRVYETVRSLSAPVYEYTGAMASAPVLEAVGLHEEFRLLAEYDGVVLAGQELEGDWGYKFATWRRSLDGAGLDHGNYYHNDYDGAKLDFACRSGLVRESRQFTDEQLTELYRCIHETLESGYPITREREDILAAAARQIQSSVDDLDDRVMRSNEKELAAAQRRPEFDGERPGSIEIYWQDLTPAKQQEILQAFGENGNYDVFPIATLDVPEEDEEFSGQEQDQAPGMEMGMAT